MGFDVFETEIPERIEKEETEKIEAENKEGQEEENLRVGRQEEEEILEDETVTDRVKKFRMNRQLNISVL